MGERPNLAYEYKGYTPRWGWRTVREKLEDIDRDNRIEWSKSGRPYLKRYLHEHAGTPIRDVITDIPPISGHAKENMGYPTQKPIALLERIIGASSNKGDIVLDPFCGCGTAIDAARHLGRCWVGIDISSFAIDMIRERRLKDIRIQAYGILADFAGAQKLAQERPFTFESWAVMRLPGFAPNTKQRGDGGVDGRATLAVPPDDGSSKLALAQVKGGKFQLSHFRDFNHVVDRDKAAWGCFVTLNPSLKTARAEAKGAGMIQISGRQYDRMASWSIWDYFDGRMPDMPSMTDPYTGIPIDQMDLLNTAYRVDLQ